MLLICAILTIFFALILKYLTRSFFHPSVIVGLVWGITLLLYLVVEHPLWRLSPEFLNVFTFWVIPFMVVSYTVSYHPNHIAYSTNNLSYNSKLFNILFPYVVILSILLIVLLIHYSGGVGENLRTFMLEKNKYPLIVRILIAINTFTIIYSLYALLHYDKVGKKRVILLITLLILISFLKSAKGAIFRIFIGIVYILYRRQSINKSKLILSTIILVILLILVTVFRNDSTAQQDDAFIKYLYIYILSPITALDLLINQEVNPIIGTNGSASFPFLFTVLNIFGLDYTFTGNPGWVTVPVFTNAYTAIWGFYADFNWVGVFIFSIIMGWVWGIVYRLQQAGNQIALLFYSATCFSLIFQAFGDFFVEAFSMDIQMLIYCIILSNGIKISPTNKNSNFPQLKIFK